MAQTGMCFMRDFRLRLDFVHSIILPYSILKNHFHMMRLYNFCNKVFLPTDKNFVSVKTKFYLFPTDECFVFDQTRD